MIYLRRIHGHSMHPSLSDGDYIIAIKPWVITLNVGDIVVVQHPSYQEIIKRIKSIDQQGCYWLAGDGVDTLSTLSMGAIEHSQILGKLCWHIKPKR